MTSAGTQVRRLAVAAGASLVTLALLALGLGPLRAAGAAVRAGTWSDASFEELLVQLCSATVIAAATCWWWGTLRLVAAARPGADGATLPTPAGLPAPLRRLVLAACGVALLAAPATPALASGVLPDDGDPATGGAGAGSALALPAATGDRPAQGPGGLPLPDRVAGGAPAAGRTPAPTGSPSGPDGTTVLVTAGDSLWRIAEAQVRAERGSASDADVAQRWHRIYAANRDRIGDDPDLILPGQRLELGP